MPLEQAGLVETPAPFLSSVICVPSFTGIVVHYHGARKLGRPNFGGSYCTVYSTAQRGTELMLNCPPKRPALPSLFRVSPQTAAACLAAL